MSWSSKASWHRCSFDRGPWQCFEFQFHQHGEKERQHQQSDALACLQSKHSKARTAAALNPAAGVVSAPVQQGLDSADPAAVDTLADHRALASAAAPHIPSAAAAPQPASGTISSGQHPNVAMLADGLTLKKNAEKHMSSQKHTPSRLKTGRTDKTPPGTATAISKKKIKRRSL